MTDKKFVPFDYQRYLDGDEVFTEHGYKVKQLTRFNDLPDIPTLGESHCMVGNVGKRAIFSDARGFFQNELYLFMLPKTKKLWIAVSKNYDGVCHGTSCAYLTKQEALISLVRHNHMTDEYSMIEIEIEV